MKKITSLISRTFLTMEKRTVIPSSTPLGITNKHPMKRKHRHKKHAAKHSMFNNVVSFLASDTHMYNPLVSRQPFLDFPPPKQILTSPGIQEDVAVPDKGGNKKLIEKVVDFLEADCYMYSPLVTNEHVCFQNHAAGRNSGGQMQKGSTVGEGEGLSSQLGGARRVVKRTVASSYRESPKHIVH